MLDLIAAAWWPALLAALVAIGVTVAIEQLGGKLGGLIGTLPTTIVPASLGLWAGEPGPFADAMSAVPPGMLLNAMFLWLWRVVPPALPVRWSLHRRLAAIGAISLLAWAVAATALTLGLGGWRAAGWPTVVVGTAGLVAILIAGLAATAQPRPAPRGQRRVGPATLLLRGLLAGAAIGLSVAIARSGFGIAAGVASVFPAIFLTTMVSLWLAQGEAVPAGAVGPMMLGSSSVAAYALLAALCFPLMGPLGGTALAWTGAVLLATLPAWAWLRRQDRRAEARVVDPPDGAR